MRVSVLEDCNMDYVLSLLGFEFSGALTSSKALRKPTLK